MFKKSLISYLNNIMDPFNFREHGPQNYKLLMGLFSTSIACVVIALVFLTLSFTSTDDYSSYTTNSVSVIFI